MRFEPRQVDVSVNVPRQQPLRELLTLTLGVLGVGAAALLVISLAAEHIAVWAPVSWEVRALGRLWEPDGPAASNWAPDERLQSLSDRLAARWPGNPYQFHVYRSIDAELNAFALPGGAIVVTTGLLETVRSENELAFVLGHELGHFRNRDHMRSLGRRFGSQLAIAITAGAVGVDFAVQPLGWVSELNERRFGRQQESDADAFAVSLLAQEYGNVSGALDFFARTPDPEFLRGVGRYVSTHPPSRERTAALESLIASEAWDTSAPTRPWSYEE